MVVIEGISLRYNDMSVLTAGGADTFFHSDVLAARLIDDTLIITSYTDRNWCIRPTKKRMDAIYQTTDFVRGRQWTTRINQWAMDGGRYLVLIDGRNSRAASVWDSVKGMFDCTPSTTYDVETMSNLAECEACSARAQQFRGIVVVGGNDVLTHVFNGLRRNPYSGLQTPVGHVPTSNPSALAWVTVASRGDYSFSSSHATFGLLKGCVRPFDLACCDLADASQRMAVSSIEWGFSADVAARRCSYHCRLRRSRATLWYLPHKGVVPPLAEQLDESVWSKMEGDFIQVWASNMSRPNRDVIVWPCEDPNVTLQDGLWHILILRNPRLTGHAVRRIMRAMRVGTHVAMEGVEFVHCRAFRFEPQKEGTILVDGQSVPYGPIQSAMLRSGGRLLGCRESESAWNTDARSESQLSLGEPESLHDAQSQGEVADVHPTESRSVPESPSLSKSVTSERHDATSLRAASHRNQPRSRLV